MLISKSPATYVAKLDELELLDLELAMRQRIFHAAHNTEQDQLDRWRAIADALSDARINQ